MSDIRLKRDLIQVIDDAQISYGGNQNFWKDNTMRGYGCGVIAVANLLVYKNLVPNLETTGKSISKTDYMNICELLKKRYLPIIPYFGINGIELSIGVNAYFVTHGIDLAASWYVPSKRLFTEIAKMLEDDLPVIISAGPDFPRVWKRDRLNLYDANSEKASSCRAHYMTVTAMDDKTLTVSSWGRKYYIDKSEFSEYVKSSSNAYLSSILKIRKISRRFKIEMQ